MGNWFDTDTKKGKASFDDQMIGLYGLQGLVADATVFDFGCAEGQIGEMMLHWGATSVDGVDNRPDAVRHALTLGVNALIADAERWIPLHNYDVCLMLGILHKLKDPVAAMRRVLSVCAQYAVIRLPGGQWPFLVDSRSGGQKIDLGAAATASGFHLFDQQSGPHGQWVGYLQRIAD